MAKNVAIFGFLFSLLVLLPSQISAEEPESAAKEFVLTLDNTNFHDTVSKHDFIVVEFYAPWCGHCKQLAPEYEKAASILSTLETPILLAKVDANEEKNKDLATQYEVKGFPTIKIFRNGGKNIQEYKGPREADGIVEYVKKQNGPASTEIKSADEATAFIGDNKIVIVGVFPKLSGEEYDNFLAVADKLRADYEIAHTSDAKHLPKGDSSVSGPFIRLFKPFDELFVDSKDFNVEAIEKFVEASSVPLVTIFNKDPNNHPFVVKFFNSPNAKAMLFTNFTSASTEAFKSTYSEIAEQYKNQGVSFLLGDLEASQGAFQYFGLKEEQVPLIVIQQPDGKKFFKPNLEPENLAAWVKEYKDGKLAPFVKSEPIPETNNEPVKVVVGETLQEIVFNSGKNVLLEFYAPWCGHCKSLAPILDEVAVSFQSDPDVVIAKLDATANDIPSDTFEVQGYPTLYFRSASGKITQYDGGRTKEAIIEFVQNNKDTTGAAQQEVEQPKAPAQEVEQPKDEL